MGATQAVKLFVIMSPVGPYYAEGFNPIKLLADTDHARAWPGGLGNAKVRNEGYFVFLWWYRLVIRPLWLVLMKSILWNGLFSCLDTGGR